MFWFSFIGVTALVGLISWYYTKGTDEKTAGGYFLAGRGLSGLVIGFSMVLTSLSTEQLIGTNASSYQSDFGVMAWTVQSIIPLCVFALWMLPKYIKMGFTTIPEFFEDRYDKGTRKIMSVLFIFFYTFIAIPSALYSGGIAFMKLIDIEGIFGLNFSQALWITVWAIGIIGSIYAIFGGLTAVAVSDTINGFILIIGGLLVPYFGLKFLGNGSLLNGISEITANHAHKLNAWGGADAAVPWETMFTGILIVNFFYWTTNQAIIQRTLGAKSLKEGQKGILISGIFLLLLPLILNLPGTISYAIFGEGLQPIDLAYPTLVSRVFPVPLLGFFGACLFGAVLSTFNSFLNSAATLFCYDIYAPLKGKVSDEQLIRMAKIVGTIIAIISMLVAPMLQSANAGLFLFLRRFAGFFNIPIIALVTVGFFNKTISGKAAKITILLHVLLYYCFVWVFKLNINFAHVMGGLYFFDIACMYILGNVFGFKRETPYEMPVNSKVNVELKEWKFAKPVIIIMLLGLAYVYTILSPIGLSGGNSIVGITIVYLLLAVIGSTLSLIYNKKHNIV